MLDSFILTAINLFQCDCPFFEAGDRREAASLTRPPHESFVFGKLLIAITIQATGRSYPQLSLASVTRTDRDLLRHRAKGDRPLSYQIQTTRIVWFCVKILAGSRHTGMTQSLTQQVNWCSPVESVGSVTMPQPVSASFFRNSSAFSSFLFDARASKPFVNRVSIPNCFDQFPGTLI